MVADIKSLLSPIRVGDERPFQLKKRLRIRMSQYDEVESIVERVTLLEIN